MPRTLGMDDKLNVPPGKNDVPYPTKLELVRSIMQGVMEGACGTVVGTGASLNVPLPFDPAFVMVTKTSGTGAPQTAIKHAAMADDDTILIIAAGTQTYDAAGLITLGTRLFNLGTDTAINEAAATLRWVAFGFRDQQGSL